MATCAHDPIGKIRGGGQERQGGELLVQVPLGVRAVLALEAELEVARAAGVEPGGQPGVELIGRQVRAETGVISGPSYG